MTRLHVLVDAHDEPLTDALGAAFAFPREADADAAARRYGGRILTVDDEAGDEADDDDEPPLWREPRSDGVHVITYAGEVVRLRGRILAFATRAEADRAAAELEGTEVESVDLTC